MTTGLQKYQKLLMILMNEHIITEAQLDEALEVQSKLSPNEKKKVGEILMDLNYATVDDIMFALSVQLGYPRATEDDLLSAKRDVVSLVPEPFARENNALAFEKEEKTLAVAMQDPDDIVVIDTLKKLTDFQIEAFVAQKSEIEKAIEKHYHELRKMGEVTELLGGLEFIVEEEGDEEVDISKYESEVDSAPIVKLVNLALTEAIKSRATDIHIEPSTDKLHIRYRIDGVLQDIMSPPLQSMMGIISRIKVLARLNLAERRLPQDGRFTIKLPDREVDVRVSILPTVLGEKVVLRLLDKTAFDLNLLNLGFEEENLVSFRRWIKRPYGMVILSGPTGSGKSTTLYSSLNAIKSRELNIVTVEDPVEYQVDGIYQVQANEKIGLTFLNALRSILRQDPDVVLIGEIRDLETADIAIKFSLTGHLVFSSLHANDAPSTVTRLLDIGVPPYLVATSLNLVMAQRLVRVICEHCKAPYEPTDEELESLGLTRKDLEGKTLYYGKGCAHCRKTGYHGRTGIFEILEMTSEIRKLIFDNANPEVVRETAIELGMQTLRQSGIGKIFKGITTVHEILRVTIQNI